MAWAFYSVETMGQGAYGYDFSGQMEHRLGLMISSAGFYPHLRNQQRRVSGLQGIVFQWAILSYPPPHFTHHNIW
jgi:hypothetical protein